MTVSDGRRGGCDEDKDLVAGAIGRDIVGCWRSLLAPQREGTIGCSSSLHPIDEKRACRGHNPGITGNNTASAAAHAATSTDGGSSTVRPADNTGAGAHTDASATGPVARATDGSISSTDSTNIASAGAHAATSTDGGSSTVRAADTASAGAYTDACTAGPGPTASATDSSTSSIDGNDTIIPLTGTNAG
jgi:hypothetical protein